MRKSKLPLKKLYTFVSHFLKEDEGFDVLSLFRQLDEKLLKSILEECAKLLLEDKPSICYIEVMCIKEIIITSVVHLTTPFVCP